MEVGLVVHLASDAAVDTTYCINTKGDVVKNSNEIRIVAVTQLMFCFTFLTLGGTNGWSVR